MDAQQFLTNPIVRMGLGMLQGEAPTTGLKEGITQQALLQQQEAKRLEALRAQQMQALLIHAAGQVNPNDLPGSYRRLQAMNLPPDAIGMIIKSAKDAAPPKAKYQTVPLEGGYAAAINTADPNDRFIIDPREATAQQWTGDGADIDMQPLPELAGAPGRGMEPLPPAPPGLSPKGEEEWNKEQAKIRAEKMSSLPKAIEGAESAIKLIDDALEHKGFQGSVGMKNWAYLFGLLDEPFPGTEEVGFLSYLKQLQGKNFLNAYETLKGGGQITQVEGQKAEQAFARMATAQSEEDFTKALREYQGILRRGLERARKEAGVTTVPAESDNDPLGIR